jgi:hypothetical protein
MFFLLMDLGTRHAGLHQTGKVLSILLLVGSVVQIANVMNGNIMIRLGTFLSLNFNLWRL